MMHYKICWVITRRNLKNERISWQIIKYIATDGREENEILEALNSSREVTKRELKQFDGGISIAIIIIVAVVGTATLKGFGDAIGKDTWGKLKTIFVKRSKEGKNTTIGFKIQNEKNKDQFNIKTEIH